HHHAAAGDRADAGHHPGRRGPAPLLVHAPRGPQAELEEVGTGVEEPGDPLAGGEPALRVLPVDGLRAAALADGGFAAVEFVAGGDVRHAGHYTASRSGRARDRSSERISSRRALSVSTSPRAAAAPSRTRWSNVSRRSTDPSGLTGPNANTVVSGHSGVTSVPPTGTTLVEIGRA